MLQERTEYRNLMIIKTVRQVSKKKEKKKKREMEIDEQSGVC
jgi:hypothetical protein